MLKSSKASRGSACLLATPIVFVILVPPRVSFSEINMAASLAEALAQLSNPAPIFQDPEDVEDGKLCF